MVLERDESTRGMTLPLELFGTDEQAILGGRVCLLGGEYRTLSTRPCRRSTPHAMSRSGSLSAPIAPAIMY